MVHVKYRRGQARRENLCQARGTLRRLLHRAAGIWRALAGKQEPVSRQIESHLLGHVGLKCSMLVSRLAAAPSSMFHSSEAVEKAPQPSTAVSADTLTRHM